MLIKCPYCGVRPVEEFVFLGDASPQRPTSLDPASMDQWYDYVFLRHNPKGRIAEFAHHVGGCRVWLVVSRNTETHEVHSCVTARERTLARKELEQ